MADLTKCAVLEDGAVRTAKGRLSYASLFKLSLPKGETDQKKARYSTSVIFPDTADLSALAKLARDAAAEKWGADYAKKFKVKMPFIDMATEPKQAELVAQGFKTMIRVASQRKPQVVQPNGRTPAEEEEAYSGRWAVVTVNAFAWEHPTGGKGVSLGLQNVQLLDHAERLGGASTPAEKQFEDLSEGVDSADDIYS